MPRRPSPRAERTKLAITSRAQLDGALSSKRERVAQQV
jgi:hypothetical protein